MLALNLGLPSSYSTFFVFVCVGVCLLCLQHVCLVVTTLLEGTALTKRSECLALFSLKQFFFSSLVILMCQEASSAHALYVSPEFLSKLFRSTSFMR